MADESFGQDFVWYEWSFVAPGDLPRDDLDVSTDRSDFGSGSQSPRTQEASDVWHDRR